ncbi:Agamous-like MADS-box protein AGL80 [Acorus calamus]|uniref:Agamous-like MADS-box protein AGL80 n=1 Tax=Acorus calamus TaxID=4465 RepID=A0AAV9D7T8_ACOCL|nr:Agamous-like MADS-box protein AGL80 [Acorus calamus]
MRSKLKLQFIENKTSRKQTYKKRKKGLSKKVGEMSTLCDVQVCTIINSPDDPDNPAIWPSPSEAQALVERFEALPHHKKNIMDQTAFLAAETKKQKRNLQKQNKENREIELKVLLGKILNGEALGEICEDDLRDLCEILEARDEMLEERHKLFRGSTSGTKDANGFIKEDKTTSVAVEASNEAKQPRNLPDLNELPPEE